jgi:hypothetical protein
VPARTGAGGGELLDLPQTGPHGQGHRGRLVVGRESGGQFVLGQHLGERVDHPAGVSMPQGQSLPFLQPLAEDLQPTVQVALSHPAQHRVDQSAYALSDGLAREGDRGGHRRMGWHAHAEQLMRAEPEQIHHGGLE